MIQTKNVQCNIDAEMAILGSCILDHNDLVSIIDSLVPSDFYSVGHYEIYKALLEMYNNRTKIDLVTLANYLRDNKINDKCGGDVYLATLVENAVGNLALKEYVEIVKSKSTLRKLSKVGQNIIDLSHNESDDLSNLLFKSEQALFSVTKTNAKDDFSDLSEMLSSVCVIDNNEPVFSGIKTGFTALDYRLIGLQNGDLIILAARPSVGKTSFALNIALNVAVKEKKNVAILSLEMSKQQLTRRILSSISDVSYWELYNGKFLQDENKIKKIGEYLDKLTEARIFIDDNVGLTPISISSKLTRLKMEKNVDLVIVDYLQLISGTGNKNNRVNEISEISRSLKILARDLNVPILALSQLSRAVEMRSDKKPQLSDLRDSGAIEQDADVVLMLSKEDDCEPVSVIELNIAKNRNGATGSIKLDFVREFMRFEDHYNNH